MKDFLKRCAAALAVPFLLLRDAIKSLPLFASVIFGVGFPVRGTDADPDPPKSLPSNATGSSARGSAEAKPDADGPASAG
jgi:hypothetical protein